METFWENVLQLSLSSSNKSIYICKNSFEFILKMNSFCICILNLTVYILCLNKNITSWHAIFLKINVFLLSKPLFFLKTF